MSDASPLTKRLSGNHDEGVSPVNVEENERLEENDGENGEEQSLPTTPASVSQPIQQQPLTPQPVPIQPYYPYPYPQYPGVPYHFPPNNTTVYQDCSTMTDPPADSRRNRGGVTEPFPEKLHRMLTVCEQEGLGDIASFFPHGRAFAIHKPRMFQEKIMKRFFRQTRLTSFQRQLNLYGFHRISTGPDHGGYYHELFLRGRPGLCVNMKRIKIKGEHSKIKRGDYEGNEPNFYAMPPITIPAPAPLGDASGTPQNSPPVPPAPQPMFMPQQPFPVPYGFSAPPGFAPPQGYAPFVPPQQQPQPMPYTAAQSPPAPAAQQQQPQQQIFQYPPPFFGYPPPQPWQGMPVAQPGFALSPNRAPATPGNDGEASPSPSKPQETRDV